MPLYPSKMLRVREHALTFYSSAIFNLDSHLSPSRSWERVNEAWMGFALAHMEHVHMASKHKSQNFTCFNGGMF
jgi:hypothetical protein